MCYIGVVGRPEYGVGSSGVLKRAPPGLAIYPKSRTRSIVPLNLDYKIFATPISMGGLGLKPYDVGLILGICGMSNAIVQTFLGGRILNRIASSRRAFMPLILIFLGYPLLRLFPERAGRIDTAVLIVLVFQQTCGFLLHFALASSIIFIHGRPAE
ncbi:hypothetical protein DFH07DRAFT_351339 [Mycena maculata]|uniref:Uncharacterized protein n=1 Tax=Mycena maculata TaxID=230809 RepID=A0AAD7NLL5_9AGAR|nr:hypothetical protein DFH07DRAFT_351339 [Mycena maculata]